MWIFGTSSQNSQNPWLYNPTHAIQTQHSTQRKKGSSQHKSPCQLIKDQSSVFGDVRTASATQAKYHFETKRMRSERATKLMRWTSPKNTPPPRAAVQLSITTRTVSSPWNVIALKKAPRPPPVCVCVDGEGAKRNCMWPLIRDTQQRSINTYTQCTDALA